MRTSTIAGGIALVSAFSFGASMAAVCFGEFAESAQICAVALVTAWAAAIGWPLSASE